jgi:hypothetical protein
MLDAQSKVLVREIYAVLALVLDFRLLLRCYLIDNSLENNESDEEMKVETNDRVGSLCVTEHDFYSKFTKCEEQFKGLKSKFTQTMSTVMKGLKVSSTRAGDLNNLSQVNTLINFNHFYK